MPSQIDTLRFMFRTWDDYRLIARKEELESELAERNTTSHAAAGISESSQRHVMLLTEMRALLDVMSERKLIGVKPTPKKSYGIVSIGVHER